jgi:hypothetical protein
LTQVHVVQIDLFQSLLVGLELGQPETELSTSTKKWRKGFADTSELVIAFERMKLGLKVIDFLDGDRPCYST